MAEMTLPNDRKYPRLYAAYQWWYEISELRKRHALRISAIERGVSNMDLDFEQTMLDKLLKHEKFDFMNEAEKELRKAGQEVACWEWATSIKGLKSGNQAAKVIALIDDIAKFDSVSKLWRYAGYGVYQYWCDDKGKQIAPKDGFKMVDGKRAYSFYEPNDMLAKGYKLQWKADKKITGWCSPFNTPLKSAVYIVVDMFIKHRTDIYREHYDKQKLEYRIKHPEKITVNGKTKYSDGHIHTMAIRKVAKLWLQHLWLVWRNESGLPVSNPWAFEHGGHVDYIAPPNYDMSTVTYS